MSDLGKLTTEGRLEASLEIDRLPTLEMLRVINQEDQKVAVAVEAVLPQVGQAVDLIVERLRKGGRLIYVGAGTSGRLGILDASELPPTYGVLHELVPAIIAGGPSAIMEAIEGAEDDAEAGAEEIRTMATPADVIVGIAASGRTPFTMGAMKAARAMGGAVIAVTCNASSPMGAAADVAIEVVVGPEVVMGSTRMKAGTAQKLVLNMLSTGTMIRLGKVYSNLMVDMKATNLKLRDRARRMVQLACNLSEERAAEALDRANGQIKLAILMVQADVDLDKAHHWLEKAEGVVYKAIELARLAAE